MKNEIENILMNLSDNYDCLVTNLLLYDNGKNQVQVDIKRNNDNIVITFKKDKSNGLQSFLEKIDENTWSYILDNFLDITGLSLKVVNDLYEKKDYNSVKELIKLVLSDYSSKLERLLDD